MSSEGLRMANNYRVHSYESFKNASPNNLGSTGVVTLSDESGVAPKNKLNIWCLRDL